METSPQPLYRSAAYINGQVIATQALVCALARLMPDRPGVRQALMQSIERLRVSGLSSQMPDDYILGIDHTEEAVQRLLPAAADPGSL